MPEMLHIISTVSRMMHMPETKAVFMQYGTVRIRLTAFILYLMCQDMDIM